MRAAAACDRRPRSARRVAGRSAAGQLGRMFVHGRAEPGLQGRGARSGRGRARRAASPTGTSSPTTTTPRRSRAGARSPRPRPPSSRTCRPRRSTSSPGTARGRPGSGECRRRAGPHREKTFLARPRLRGGAVRGAATARPTSTALDADAPARHRQERPLRLRRQGPGRGRRRRRLPRRVARHAAACRACSSSALPLACEVSVIVARTSAARPRRGPPPRIGTRSGILDVAIVPARVADGVLARRARHRARGVATALDYRGVLCVEMFVSGRRAARQRDRAAPAQQRPLHASTPATSQFEQQARALAGLPLGDPRRTRRP